MRHSLRWSALVLVLVANLEGREPDRTVIKAAVPFYPPVARAAKVQGTVVLEVRTEDGAVADASPVEGNSLLSKAAVDNVRSWIFVNHMNMTFRVTFKYKLSGSCKGEPNVQMNFPFNVEVCAKPFPPLE